MCLSETRARVNWINTIFLLGTFLVALVGTPWYIVTHGLGWPETLTFFFIWLAVGLSITAGYHRLFSHKTYQAAWPVRLALLIFGAGALENSVANWAADHRIHHTHVDHDRDPYNIQKGFWWAHIGWIFFQAEEIPRSVVADLMEDPLVRWQDRWYRWIGIGVAFGIPLVVGLLTGNVLGCLLIGGVLRVVVSHHGTFFINSLCHYIGRQPYSREHSARDSAVMAVLAFGEGYHNYHHSFPFDYRNGIRAWHFDPAKWLIYVLSHVGLVRDLRRASDTAVLKAKVDIQFETAKERIASGVSTWREQQEARLHDTYVSLQAKLQNLLTVQRRGFKALLPEGVETASHSLEERLSVLHRELDESLADWKRTLRQMKRGGAVAA
jgi:stearoyl-CoA desaturase (delta-9 desaturase)